MDGADDRPAFWHGLITQQIGKQRTRELRPIDIVRRSLSARDREVKGLRTAAKVYYHIPSGRDVVNLQVWGTAQIFAEQCPDQFFLW
jgi:hypothetical protein